MCQRIITLPVLAFALHLSAQPPLPHPAPMMTIGPRLSRQLVEVVPGSAVKSDRADGTVLWSEDFESGLNGWTINNIAGPVNWELTSTGNTGGFTPGPLASTTGFPGGSWIVADSDLNGIPAVLENSTITSPHITGLDTVPFMLLRFEQSFRQLNNDQTTVEVSGNGGANWTVYPVNTTIAGNQSTPGAPAAQTIRLNISNALGGGSNDIRIRFRWLSTEGYTYSWQVDDIALIAAQPNDLTLIDATHAVWSTDDLPDFTDLPYTVYPETEVRPLTFRAHVMNNGSTAQTNVRLEVQIDGPGSNDATLTSSSITLAPTGVDSLFITGYTPPAATGNYEITYSILQDQAEDSPEDNVTADEFAVSTHTFARDKGSMDQDYWNEGAEYLLGNWFQVQADHTLYAIDVALSNRSDPGAIISAELLDGSRTLIMACEEHVVQNSDLNNLGGSHFISLPLLAPTDLDAGEIYFIDIKHYGGPPDVWVGTSGNSIPQTSLIYDTPSSHWFYVDLTPMVRMNFDPTAAVADLDQASFQVVAMPSVFSDATTIHFRLDTSRPVQWELHDVMGRVVARGVEGTLAPGAHQVKIDGNGLADGSYLFVLTSGAERASVRLIRSAGR